MTHDAVAGTDASAPPPSRAGLAAEAVTMGLGLLLASGAAWVGAGALLLPGAAQKHPDAWLDLVFVVVAMMVTVLDLALLGVFALLRGLVCRRTAGRVRWSRWWALALAGALTALVVVAATADSPAPVLFVLPALATLALYAPVVAAAPRVRLPRWAIAVLATVLAGVVLMVASPFLGFCS